MAKEKRTNNVLQYITQTIKDWAMQTPQKTGMSSIATEGDAVTSGTHRVKCCYMSEESIGLVITTDGTYPWSFVTQIFHIS